MLGGNDGLVSNFSLVMGIAGATEGQAGVLLAGLAGLLAGALSMALGEWISVKSSQELYENQMQLEMDELENNPAGELRELKLIYIAKGIPAEQAAEMAEEIMKDKEHAHQVLVREELGINTEELKGSAMEAAVSSFVLFAIGAVIPVLPFMFTSGMTAIIISVAGSAAGLFLIGRRLPCLLGGMCGFQAFGRCFWLVGGGDHLRDREIDRGVGRVMENQSWIGADESLAIENRNGFENGWIDGMDSNLARG